MKTITFISKDTNTGTWKTDLTITADEYISIGMSPIKLVTDQYFIREPQRAQILFHYNQQIDSLTQLYAGNMQIGNEKICHELVRIWEGSKLLMTGIIPIQLKTSDEANDSLELTVYDVSYLLKLYADSSMIVQIMEDIVNNLGIIPCTVLHDHLLQDLIGGMFHAGFVENYIPGFTLNLNYDPLHLRTFSEYPIYDYGVDWAALIEQRDTWAQDRIDEIEASHITGTADYYQEDGFYIEDGVVVYEMRAAAQVYALGSPAFYRRYRRKIRFVGTVQFIKDDVFYDELAIGSLPAEIDYDSGGDELNYGAHYDDVVVLTGSAFIRSILLIAETYKASDLLRTALLINDLAIYCDPSGNLVVMNKMSSNTAYEDVVLTDDDIYDDSIKNEILWLESFNADLLIGLDATDVVKQMILDYFNGMPWKNVINMKLWDKEVNIGQFISYGTIRAKIIEIQLDEDNDPTIKAIYGGEE